MACPEVTHPLPHTPSGSAHRARPIWVGLVICVLACSCYRGHAGDRDAGLPPDGDTVDAQSACPTGQSRCGASCVDTPSDSANCGACGNACPAGTVCSSGACCGDDVVEGHEQCDDGNHRDGDGCSSTCQRQLALAVGPKFTCALPVDGSVRCWGFNDVGQLGLGDTTSRGDVPGQMGAALPAVDLGTGMTAVHIAASALGFACALLDDATVKCWGWNAGGSLGLGDTMNRGDMPGQMGDALPAVDLGTGRTVVALSTGAGCAVLDDGSVKCWGAGGNALGLGDFFSRGDMPGEMGDALPAVDLGSGRRAIGVTAGALHTCALLDGGTLKCWGDNYPGDLGLGDTVDRGGMPGQMGDALPAVDLGTGREAVAVAVGGRHTCALLDDGAVKCWGANDAGQLGLGDTRNRGDMPGQMGDALPAVDLGTGRTAVAVAAGADHTCAVLDDGAVKCWGFNLYGELGLGDRADRGDRAGEMGDALRAVDLGTGRRALGVWSSSSSVFTCALLDDGSVKCWGYNVHGELGLGDTNNRGDNPGEMGDALPAVDLGH